MYMESSDVPFLFLFHRFCGGNSWTPVVLLGPVRADLKTTTRSGFSKLMDHDQTLNFPTDFDVSLIPSFYFPFMSEKILLFSIVLL